MNDKFFPILGIVGAIALIVFYYIGLQNRNAEKETAIAESIATDWNRPMSFCVNACIQEMLPTLNVKETKFLGDASVATMASQTNAFTIVKIYCENFYRTDHCCENANNYSRHLVPDSIHHVHGNNYGICR